MSHNITNTNGKSEMAYVGEAPWHGLGQRLEAGAPIETWLDAAGMGWKVLRAKVRYPVSADNQTMREWPAQHVLFRADTKAPLGLVSERFKVVQPKQVLEFFRDLCETNKFSLETAGTLRGGAVYWALAKIHEEAKVGPGDTMKGYVMLSTACDGTRRTVAKNTTVRVVCNNTLSMADNETGKNEVCVSHRSVFDAVAVKTDLGIAHQSFEAFMGSARSLAKRRLSKADVDRLTLRLLGGEDALLMDEARRAEILEARLAKAIHALYHGAGRGAQLLTAQGTAWGYVNAVTEYVDHFYPARSAENRLDSAWFGYGERLKNGAFKRALELVAA